MSGGTSTTILPEAVTDSLTISPHPFPTRHTLIPRVAQAVSSRPANGAPDSKLPGGRQYRRCAAKTAPGEETCFWGTIRAGGPTIRDTRFSDGETCPQGYILPHLGV